MMLKFKSLDFRSFDPTLPEPIAFNCWKHHLGFIKESINFIQLSHNESIEPYQNLIESISGSLIDIYIGHLSSQQIAEQVVDYLNDNKVISFSSFKQWLENDGKDYQCIILSDQSKWTLRMGIINERFVHIHPGRYSNHTIRVKATTLKTAMAYSLLYGLSNKDFSIDHINFARENLAFLSPMKRTSSLTPVSNLLRLFFS